MFRLLRAASFLAMLLAACLAAPVSAADREPLTLYLRAAMTIEADGSLSRLEWHGGGKLPAVLRDSLDERVRSWDFEPGTIGGEPARTETTLRVRLRAEERGEDVMVSVQSASTGAAMGRLRPPAYPMRALRLGEEGAVLVQLAVEPGGTPRVAIAGYEGDKGLRDEFVEAVATMFDHLDIQHELVGGAPVAAEFSIPVDFCMGSRACGTHEWPEAATETASATEPGAPVPVGSVARLVTDVQGTPI